MIFITSAPLENYVKLHERQVAESLPVLHCTPGRLRDTEVLELVPHVDYKGGSIIEARESCQLAWVPRSAGDACTEVGIWLQRLGVEL